MPQDPNADAEVIIVGDDGTEHVFPAGFDPKKAAGIVRASDPNSVEGKRASRDANIAAQAPVVAHASDVDAAKTDGLHQGMVEGAVNYGTGLVKGAASLLDPRTYLEGARAVTDTMLPTMPGAFDRQVARGQGLIDTGKQLASGDSETIGNVTGQVLAGKALPRIMPHVPGGMVKVGAGVEAAGEMSKKISPFGMAEAVFRGDPYGAAVAAAPYAVKGIGQLIRKGGEMMGGLAETPFHEKPLFEQMDSLPTENPAPVTARGSAPPVQSEPTPFHEKPLYQQMDDLPSAQPPLGGRQGMPVQPTNRPTIAEGRAINKTWEQEARNLSARDRYLENNPPEETPAADEAAVASVGQDAGLSALELQAMRQGALNVQPNRVRSTPPVAPSSAPAPAAATIEEQLHKQASGGKRPVAEVPTSKSKGTQGNGSEMSATPGLTVNDMKAIGLDPTIKVTALAPKAIEEILKLRKARGASYAETAALEKRLNALVAKDF